MLFYRIGRVTTYLLVKVLFRLRYEGMENITKQRGFMVCSNHRSNFDPIFVAQKIKPQLHFMAKEELFRNKFVGFILKALGAFPVKRGKGDTGAIDFAVQTLENGRVLAMFPEGSRSADGALLKPKSGAALVAAQTKADVLPVAVCFEGKLKFRTKVTVRYGKFLENEELGMKNGTPSELRGASKLIMARIAELLEKGSGDVCR